MDKGLLLCLGERIAHRLRHSKKLRTAAVEQMANNHAACQNFESVDNYALLFLHVSAPVFSMSSIQVRPATLRDAKAIAQIHTASALEAYRGLVPDDQLKAMSSVEKRQAYWREAIEYCEPQVQVAIDGDKIVGFVGFDRSRDEKSRQTTGEIWAIYAAPSHWNQGVGVALWDAARDGLLEEGCTNVTAWIPLRNERALRFHEMAGFKREMSTAKTAVIGSIKIEEVRVKRPLNG